MVGPGGAMVGLGVSVVGLADGDAELFMKVPQPLDSNPLSLAAIVTTTRPDGTPVARMSLAVPPKPEWRAQ